MLERISSLARIASRALLVLALLVLLRSTSACDPLVPSTTSLRALEPSNKPVDACIQACNSRASRQCSDAECGRGCEFILDRLLEKEMDNVVACVARSSRRCRDLVWAECAARIGVHADGGPPAPPPPIEDE